MTDQFETSPARQPTVSKSAEHAPIRSVELRADWRARKWARERMATRCQEDGFPEVAEAYRRGDRDEFLRDDIEAYLAGAAASADREEILEARVAELEAALAKANEPEWFFGNAGVPHFSLYEAVKTHVDPTGGLLIGAQTHLVKVDTARPCKTIWALARFHEPSGEWRVLPCATEAEARALLKEDEILRRVG